MTEPTRPRRTALLLLTFAAVGAGTSALLLHEYLVPQGGACGVGGGCDTVRQSAYATVAGLPLPALGLAFFAAFAVALLHPRLRARGLPTILGAMGAITAVVLLALQGLVIGAWCPFCVVVDACALGLGLTVLAPALRQPGPLVPAPSAVAILGAGLALPMALGVAMRTEAPEPSPVDPSTVASLTRPTADGRTTIVEFVDFQCPFCRRQHATMAELLRSYGDQVELVVHHLPLRMHPHAREAARVACCAEEQGHGEAVADALMRADDLSDDAPRDAAQAVGVDLAVLDTCLQSERPDQRLDDDAAQARAAGVHRLPTCFIGDQRFEGLQSEATLRDAIDRAIASASQPS